MRYVTAFDAASDPLRHWDFWVFGLAFLWVGMTMILIPRFHEYRGLRGTGMAWIGGIVVAFSVL